MLIPVCCFIAGLVAMGRTKPTTRVYGMTCLGPKSGIVYQVEDMREIGVIVVRPPGKTAMAQFARASTRQAGTPGLIYQHGVGDPRLLDMIRQDFGGAAKPAAVGPRSTEPKNAPARGAPAADVGPQASGRSTP